MDSEIPDAPTRLASGFPAANRDEWRALVAKTLKGAGAESLDRPTPDGLIAHALYTALDLPEAPSPRPARGAADWDIRVLISETEPADANGALVDALAGGATSALIALAGPGRRGVDLGGPGDFARLMRGVLMDIAPIALDARACGRIAAGWLDGAAKASPTAPLAFHLDPLTAFAQSGQSAGPVDGHLAEAAVLGARLAQTYPRASLTLASGVLAHEAGATPAWEIAVAAASALSQAKALNAAGLSLDYAWGRIVLGLCVEAQPFPSITKLRAARLVWARLTGACGAAVPARIEARSSERMLTRAEPWTNLIRLTCAAFAGAVGGADAVVLSPHDAALGGEPDPLAARLIRNAQIILMEEGRIGQVGDPAGGAFALEAQSLDLARAAWSRFSQIEAQGGIVAALSSGAIAAACAAGREALTSNLASKASRLLGVTDFAPADTAPPGPGGGFEAESFIDPAVPGRDGRCPPLVPIRLEDLAR